MDHEFVATIEDEHYGLEEAPASVEAETQLPRRTVIVKFLDPQRPCSCLHRVFRTDSMLECRLVNLHIADDDNASRMT